MYTPNLNFKFFKKYIHNGSHIVQKNASNLVVKIDFKVHVCVKSYLEKGRCLGRVRYVRWQRTSVSGAQA